MGDFSDDYGGYDMLGLYEQRDEDRRVQRAKLLTPPKQKPMHPELRKMWEDYFDKFFRRKPLTGEGIAAIIVEMNGNEPTAPFWRDLARAIEAAHGIKE